MADGKVTVAAPSGNRRQFEQTLTMALKSRGNLLTLARCAKSLELAVVEGRVRELVAETGVVTDIDWG
jgi:hypothetical protein